MRTTNNYGIGFAQDNFRERRASQHGAGVAYDMESLLTGAEIAAGLGYGDKREVHPGAVSTAVRAGQLPITFLAMSSHEVAQAIAAGRVSPDLVEAIAPRVKASSTAAN